MQSKVHSICLSNKILENFLTAEENNIIYNLKESKLWYFRL